MGDEIFEDRYDCFDNEDYWAELNESYSASCDAARLEKLNLKKGKHTHAYKEELLNSEIVRLLEEGLSYSKIAAQLNCPKSTVGFRISMMKRMKLICRK